MLDIYAIFILVLLVQIMLLSR